ncbi:MAG: hypothetical protein DMD96_04335 [Candidatus Rokuibacteriota bacterium]|nr:MAG: hypothetical protein DMD96_04335 [Candidatus Rokubacteria bacterium]
MVSCETQAENPGGWLTTVVARVCLDMLRSRRSRREDSLESRATESAVGSQAPGGPEQEVVLAASVGLASLDRPGMSAFRARGRCRLPRLFRLMRMDWMASGGYTSG